MNVRRNLWRFFVLLILATVILITVGGPPWPSRQQWLMDHMPGEAASADAPPATEAPVYGSELPPTPAAIEAPGPNPTTAPFVCAPPVGYEAVPGNELTTLVAEIEESEYFISAKYDGASTLTFTNADGSVEYFNVTNGLNVNPVTLKLIYGDLLIEIGDGELVSYICIEQKQMYIVKIGEFQKQSG